MPIALTQTSCRGNDAPAPSRPPLLQTDGIRSIAVFRALQLGDMLCAVPALRALRAALPAAHITLIGLPWAAQFAQRFDDCVDDFAAFPGHPAFPEQAAREEALPAFYADMQARRFDLALQLHGSGPISNQIVGNFGARIMAGCFPPDAPAQSASAAQRYMLRYPDYGPEPLRLLALLEFLGAPPTPPALAFPLGEEDWQALRASELTIGLGAVAYVCMHAGARARDKCWPPTLFARVADSLVEEFGVRIVLTGSGSEHALAQAVADAMRHPCINAAAPISIGAMAALMNQSQLLICNDTGVSHIAAGLWLPSVVIFSKSDMQRWAPLDQDLHRCVWDSEGQRIDAVLAHARMLLRQA